MQGWYLLVSLKLGQFPDTKLSPANGWAEITRADAGLQGRRTGAKTWCEEAGRSNWWFYQLLCNGCIFRNDQFRHLPTYSSLSVVVLIVFA